MSNPLWRPWQGNTGSMDAGSSWVEIKSECICCTLTAMKTNTARCGLHEVVTDSRHLIWLTLCSQQKPRSYPAVILKRNSKFLLYSCSLPIFEVLSSHLRRFFRHYFRPWESSSSIFCIITCYWKLNVICWMINNFGYNWADSWVFRRFIKLNSICISLRRIIIFLLLIFFLFIRSIILMCLGSNKLT